VGLGGGVGESEFGCVGRGRGLGRRRLGVGSGGIGSGGRGRVLLDGDWDGGFHLEVLALLDPSSRSVISYYEEIAY
jgi:hypothetical protein